ncbi:MAG: hypothetical protein HYU53_18475 [Acidobacteria bacterium]|nr:hypothetical protein [Acidobacteriota bacterium]
MSEKRNPPSPEPRHARSASVALRASILAGPEVSVIEISRQELVVESDVRLTPGAGICLNVSIAGANYLAGGRITKVDAALAAGQVRYRASVKLDNEMPAFDLVQPQPAVEPAVPEPPSVGPAPRTAPEPAAAEEPMDHQQTLQMLKTALRSSEAVRKELVEELEAARAKWDAERQALEARVGQVQKSATTAGQQISNAREAERLLAGKYAQEQAAWVKERAALQESARQAEARAKEFEPKVKDLETRAAQAEAAARQAGSRVDQIQQEARTIQERERAAAARVKELEAGQRALQEAAKKAGELSAKAAHDLAAVRDNEQRLAKRIEEMTGKMDGLLEDRQRQEAELEAAMAMVAAAEQKIGGHEKERRDWAAQKERLSARLQTTEKWCADQQHLLYELQQHLGRASTLLDGWTPQSLDEADGEQAAARKATA